MNLCLDELLRPHRVWFRVAAGALLSGLLYAPCATPQTTAATTSPTPIVSTGKAAQLPSEAGSAQIANGSAPGQPTAPKPVTATHLAALPAPLPAAITQGIDVDARSKTILAHLSEVIRFYRMTIARIQTTGEPSDMLYAEQAQTVATQAAQLAFQSARDEAALLARIQGKPGASTQSADGETQKLHGAQVRTAKQIEDLETQDGDLDKQIAAARAGARPALQQQKEDVEGQLELAHAMLEALSKVSGVSTAQSNSGLQGDIDRLQQAVPELMNSKVKPVTNSMDSIGALHDAGVASQAVVLFQLISTRSSIDQLIQESQKLHDQALDLRTPLLKILRATVAIGQNLPSAAPDAAAPGGPAAIATHVDAPSASADRAELTATKKTYDQLTDAFKTISDVSIPITQEALLLQQARGNLLSWRAAVDAERATILHSLLLRVGSIAIALALILGLGEVWRRATGRYVGDIRRRRQLLLIRRMVIGFLSGLVLIFGFVTQFSSLATFAGFITAGIAVGLQTILLSVAAYFFIVGRYGVRVGDRITVAGVTGDVVEVGLVRFYMMELIGSGTELHPTGRIAVFANSVLFQTGTPLYKQIPGTNYAWHEITVKVKPETNYQPALDAIRGAVEKVYTGYKTQIEQQHTQTEAWLDAALRSPQIESRLELTDGLQYAVLYPVQISDAGTTDEKIIHAVIEALTKDPTMSQTIDGQPTVHAVIKT
jgi:small-conductance mechanosensitive channel